MHLSLNLFLPELRHVPTLACGSALTEKIEGMDCEGAARLTRQDIVAALDGLPSRKQHAVALAIETLRAALEVVDWVAGEL